MVAAIALLSLPTPSEDCALGHTLPENENFCDSLPDVLHLQIHGRTILLQPFLSLMVVRHHLVHLVPERLGVVHAVNVTEFVHHDVVDDRWRSHHALPMKGEVAFCRARSPAMTKISYIDVAERNPDLWRVIVHSFGDALVAARDEVITKSGFRGGNFASVHQIAA